MAIEQLWHHEDQFLVLWPSDQCEATYRHTFIVEGLLGAAASLRDLSRKRCHPGQHTCSCSELLLLPVVLIMVIFFTQCHCIEAAF